MKQLFYLALSVVVLMACDQKGRHSKYDNEENVGHKGPATDKKATLKKVTAAIPVLGERINNAATIRNSPGGEPIAALLDYIPLRCAPLNKDWYPVSIDIDITKEEFSKPLFHKGRKLKVNGVPAGTLQRDTKLPVATNGEKMWATINGYTEKKNIRSGSIIESAIVSYLSQHKGRSIADMQDFIDNFQLEEDKNVLKPYQLYFNYESGIDDPSPLYRLVLVFQGKQLLGVIHTRPVALNGYAPRRLQRDFTIHFLPGIDKSLKEDFSNKFNKFILSVD
ncbi:hypothetical protein [Chitinophaga nivalis]|uniref:SH3 domain-containing protein n=1 Tax=Chitinophaga nivalis TaxID=2991709 RepID=A0ABT3ISL4_9BACT|nr:hypothetical protein [Chitinophaga nivalis]MCW3463611.1 hypothetical protein [Chitinophaga nivalis]MCW3486699.1 hypothetical protein [Chitinophaga nivalis]